MKQKIKMITAATTVLMMSSLTSLADDHSFANKIKKQDWASAEIALMQVSTAPKDKIFTEINMAFLYATTGRTDKARDIYKKIIKGRRNDFAMTVSGQPRKIKYIAKDGLRMIGE